MNKQEALEHLMDGKELSKEFEGETVFEVRIQITELCNFSRHKKYQHEDVGPIHVRFWSIGNPHWIHITWEQLFSYLDRHFKE